MFANIAIVEDDFAAAEHLKTLILNYKDNNGFTFGITVFHDALEFLNDGASDFKVVFMDIQMPMVDGMEAAARLRKVNSDILLIFVTNLASYAVAGYSVHAYDFLLKPVDAGSFNLMFDRVCNELLHKLDEATLTLNSKLITKRVRVVDILYAEIVDHNLIFHFVDGTEFAIRATMNDYEKKLVPHCFSRCNNCYLVNMCHITEISDNVIKIGKYSLVISKSRKTQFLEDFARFVGGG